MITATRIIGVDAAHRVPNHGSKCRSLHGHRYTFEATAGAEQLQTAGEAEGMVIDFGVLKEAMMFIIDRLIDHGMIMWKDDPLLREVYPETTQFARSAPEDKALVAIMMERDGYMFFAQGLCSAGKLLIVPFIPTAENLAKFFFTLLNTWLTNRSNGSVFMVNLKVYETPNCFSEYPSSYKRDKTQVCDCTAKSTAQVDITGDSSTSTHIYRSQD